MPIPIYAIQQSAIPAEWPVIHVLQDTGSSARIIFKDTAGVPIDLSTVDHLKYIAKEYEMAKSLYLDLPVTVIDAVNGEIEITFPATDLKYPGVWLSEVTAYDVSNNPILKAKSYIEVELSYTATSNSYAPLSISDLRMELMDRSPEDNDLLESLEFSDAELLRALRKPIDYWNEALPPISATYTATTFPFRANWTIGALGELFKQASFKLLRNRFPTQAGGITVDDKQRGQIYAQWGVELLAEYKQWVANHKYSLNMANAWGATYNRNY